VHSHISHCLSAPVHICVYCYMLPFKTLMSSFRVLSYASCSALDYIPAHPNSVHFSTPQISLISFNHPWYIFVTTTHFPVSSTWPRHTAQCHLHSILAHYLNNPPCPPSYKIPVFPHTAYISCTILKTEAACSSTMLIALSKSRQHDIPQDLNFHHWLWEHQFSYFTFSLWYHSASIVSCQRIDSS
jgi:hypothetical protein